MYIFRWHLICMQWNTILSKSISSPFTTQILHFKFLISNFRFSLNQIFSFSINFGHFDLYNMTLNGCFFLALIWCFIKQQSDIWEKRTSKYDPKSCRKKTLLSTNELTCKMLIEIGSVAKRIFRIAIVKVSIVSNQWHCVSLPFTLTN